MEISKYHIWPKAIPTITYSNKHLWKISESWIEFIALTISVLEQSHWIKDFAVC